MKFPNLRLVALAAVAAPLSLSLAACGSGSSGDEAEVSGEALEKVAPPEGKVWSDVVTKTEAGGYAMGNPEAPIKLVEFGALSCSHCAEFAEAASAEIRETFVNSGRVSFELRLYMLNPLDPPAALLATCGAPEAVHSLADQFWKFQPEAFANIQKNQAALAASENLPIGERMIAIAQAAGMSDFFASRGIALDQGKACFAKPGAAEELVRQTETQGKEYNITGTPTFLLNGKKLDTNSWPEIKAALEKAGAR
jgi:protein-disulfide isomerase